jgi:hypothetical protein
MIYEDIKAYDVDLLNWLADCRSDWLQHTRLLDLSFTWHGISLDVDVAARRLFPFLAQLEFFISFTGFIYPTVLSTWPHAARSTLRELTIMVYAEFQSQLMILNEFTALTLLSLNYDCYDTAKDYTVELIPWTLTLPRMETFSLWWRGPCPDLSGCIAFLLGCRFPPTCTVFIDIPNLQADRSLELNAFFDSLSQSPFISLNCAGISSLSSIFAHAAQVDIGACIPHVDLFQHSRLPRDVYLPLMSDTEYTSWDLLDTLIEVRSSSADSINIDINHHRFASLCLHIGNDMDQSPFLWNSRNRTFRSAEWFDEMLDFAVRLHALGVMILDMNGNDVLVVQERTSDIDGIQ